MLITLLSRTKSDDEQLIKLSLLAALLWMTHYYFIGVMAPAISSLLAAIRYFIEYKFKNIRKKIKIILGIIISIIMASIIFIEGPSYINILTFMAAVIVSFSVFLFKNKKLRIGLIIADLIWIVINILSYSIGGVLFDIIAIIITVFTLVKRKLNLFIKK